MRHHNRGVHQDNKKPRSRTDRCKFCKEVFTNKYQKEKHEAQVHRNGLKPTRTCQVCNSEFQLFVDFKQHIESHEGSFVCIICGISNRSESALNTHKEGHKRVEKEAKNLICDYCGHKVYNKVRLHVHMIKHKTDVKLYMCAICGQSFKYMGPYHYHMLVHKGKKNHVSFYHASSDRDLIDLFRFAPTAENNL